MSKIELGPLPEPESGNWEVGASIRWADYFTADQMRAYAEAEVAKERERCAKVCEAKAEHCDAADNYYGANAARDLADAIRALDADVSTTPSTSTQNS